MRDPRGKCDQPGPDTQVYTKTFDPFSIQGPGGAALGLTHDFLTELLAVAFPNQKVTVETVWLAGNPDIFAKLQSAECAAVNASALCIGAAAISILPEREEFLDFLPSYFRAGCKAMVHGSLDVSHVLERVCMYMVWIGLGVISIVVLMTLLCWPLVWAAEMLQMHDTHELPIFISKTEIDEHNQMLEEEWMKRSHSNSSDKQDFLHRGRTRYIEMHSLLNSLLWTLNLLVGCNVAYPRSLTARSVRWLAYTSHRLMVILITALATSVLTTERLLSQASSVQKVEDLSHRKVCSVDGNSCHRFLTGASRIPLDVVTGISSTEEMFWLYEQHGKKGSSVDPRRTCQAVVYDWPLLQVGYIRNGITNNSTRKSFCHQCPDKASLLNEVMTIDPYGIAMPQGHKLFDYLSEASLEIILDITLQNKLLEKWNLAGMDSNVADVDMSSLVQYVLKIYGLAIASVVGLILLGVIVFCTVRKKLNFDAIDARINHSVTVEHLHVETARMNQSVVNRREDHELTHEIRVEVNKVKAAILELLKVHDIKSLSEPTEHQILRSRSFRMGTAQERQVSGNGNNAAGVEAKFPTHNQSKDTKVSHLGASVGLYVRGKISRPDISGRQPDDQQASEDTTFREILSKDSPHASIWYSPRAPSRISPRVTPSRDSEDVTPRDVTPRGFSPSSTARMHLLKDVAARNSVERQYVDVLSLSQTSRNGRSISSPAAVVARSGAPAQLRVSWHQLGGRQGEGGEDAHGGLER